MAEEATAERAPQFEVIDAEEFKRFLNLREHAAFELDTLRGDDVVGCPAVRPVAKQNRDTADDGRQGNIANVIAVRTLLYGFEEIDRACCKDDDDQKRHKLADAVDHGGMAGKNRFLPFRFFCGGVGSQIGVAETAFECDSLDGLAANWARF